jgi:hypothetical protein
MRPGGTRSKKRLSVEFSFGGVMSKREDARIAALAKKNAEKVVPPKRDRAAQFDSTLRQRSEEEEPETRRLFKEMKRREF